MSELRADDQAQIFDKLKMNDAMIVQFFLPKYVYISLPYFFKREVGAHRLFYKSSPH